MGNLLNILAALFFFNFWPGNLWASENHHSSAVPSDPLEQIRKICTPNQNDDFDLKDCGALKLAQSSLSAAQLKKLKSFIHQATDAWPDSILEADVDTLFEDFKIEETLTVLDSKSSVSLGTSVQFSFLGWETSCIKDDYDAQVPSTYRDCSQGRIRETIFINEKFSDWEILKSPDLVL